MEFSTVTVRTSSLAATSFANSTAPITADTDCTDDETYENLGGFKIFLLSASLICIIVSSVIGNCLIFLIVYKKPSLLTIANRYIFHLAVCQFIMTTMVMPYTLVSVFAQGWVFSCGWCAFTAFCKSMLLCSIVLTLLLISVERYISITAPMRYHQSIIVNYWFLLVVAVWIVSTLFAIPQTPLFEWGDTVYVKYQYTCSTIPKGGHGLGSLLFYFLVGFVSPMVIMGFVYLRIFFVARKLIKRLHPMGSPREAEEAKNNSEDSPKDSDRDTKRKEKWVLDEWRVAKTGILAISAYAVCWIPFFMVMLFFSGGKERPWWVTMSTWMAMASCSFNPYVYVFRSRSMRRQASEILASMIGRDVFNLESGSVTGQVSRRESGQSGRKGRYMKIPGFRKSNPAPETRTTTLTTVTTIPEDEPIADDTPNAST